MTPPDEAYPSFDPSPAAWPEAPDGRPSDAAKAQAAAALLRYGMLSHTVGDQEAYEVRTTIATRQTWSYRCAVFRHGTELTRAFGPIVSDRTRQLSSGRHAPAGREALRLRFALEAVELHFARCAVLQDSLRWAALAPAPTPPPPGSRWRAATLVVLLSAALITAYGVWTRPPRSARVPPPERPPAAVREAAPPDRPLADPPVRAPLPASSGSASRESRDGQVQAPRSPLLRGPPTVVRLSDLLARDGPPAAVHAGDLLRLTGWIHRISRDPDGTYRLQVSPSRPASAPGLHAVVPHPDQAAGAPAVRAQLQAVRAFIMQRLLQQREPSPRGSVMRQPPWVQLTGQWSAPDAPRGEPPERTGPRDAPARGEMRPVLAIQFAPPPGPVERAQME